MTHGASWRAFGVLALAAATPVGLATAQQPTGGDHRFFVRGGAFVTDMTTNVRLTSLNLPGDGTDISFEDDLGLADGRTIPSVEAGWRPARDWLIGVEYFGIDRRRTVVIDRTIQFEDSIYDVGAEVTAGFRSNLYKIQVGWSPWQTQTAELGFTLGAHLTDFSVSLAGQASVTGGTIGRAGFAEERREVLAPLPNLGTFGSFEIVPDVRLVGRVHWFSLRIGDYKGGLTDAQLGAEWKFHRHFGIGGAWRLLNYRLDIDTDNLEGRIRYKFNGPMLYAIATF